ncbi:MAG TPA: DUF2283 domain-containing protein [Thermoanaerobaculia bacterium]|jgi:uncharacterized protein YuzE|nr:DUF2283 domain-containing protein [Thermoanaerobaculia bacterium]
MRVIYDAGTDTLSIILSDQKVAESDEEKPGVILDFDAGGNVVSMEILDASRRVDQPTQMVYELMPTGTSGFR